MKNNNYLRTGAKKVVATASIAAVLLGGLPITAYADVNPSVIVGDLNVSEDRSEIKKNDVANLKTRYEGGFISLVDIENAIELSNVLNSYYFDLLDYTNTTPSELLTVDIATLHDNYEAAVLNGTPETFCSSAMFYKPACDGFITLSSKTVATEIKNSIINRVVDIYQSKGHTVTGTPKVIISGEEISCVLTVNNKLKKVTLTGENILKVIKTIKRMNKMYKTAIKNVGGTSPDNDGTFMYNGIDSTTNESVYLSLPDDDKKASVQKGVNMARNIANAEKYQISLGDTKNVALTEDEKALLRDKGYSEAAISGATKDIVVLTKISAKKLTK